MCITTIRSWHETGSHIDTHSSIHPSIHTPNYLSSHYTSSSIRSSALLFSADDYSARAPRAPCFTLYFFLSFFNPILQSSLISVAKVFSIAVWLCSLWWIAFSRSSKQASTHASNGNKGGGSLCRPGGRLGGG